MSRAQLGVPALAAIVASAALLVLAVGWFAVVAPQRHRAQSATHAVEQTQTQIAAVQGVVQTPTTPEKQPLIETADIYRILKAMPSLVDEPDVLLQIDQVARAAGVDVLTITPHNPTAGATYTTVPIDLTVLGDYYSITDMLYRLRAFVAVRHGALDASGRLYSVSSIALAPTGIGGRHLTGQLTVNAYVYGTVAGADGSTTTSAAATSATSTTSTSTTSTTSTTTTGTTTGSGG